MNTFLQERGYSKPYEDHFGAIRYWCKRIKTKHHIVVREWAFNGNLSYEVIITWENDHEIWSENKYYSLSETQVKEHLEGMEQKLYNAALAMGANPEHYQFGGE